MSLSVGIVGLPNVGKSTLFQVLTSCNIKYYNVGMRKVINISVSERLYKEVEEAVKQNKYETKSELFRDLLRAWKEGRLAAPAHRFHAETLLKNVRKHAAKGGHRDLSAKHDHYLYGE